MTNANPGGIRWQDGTPADNESLKDERLVMSEHAQYLEKIDELTEWIVEAMDMSALENYAKQQLSEYYNSPEGVEDFNTNYEEMKEIKGDD
jgi:hypothetical protein